MFETALFISAFTTLFVIIDPPGCAPIFATLTKGTSRKHQRTMAFKSVGIAAFILIGFAYVGEWLFAKLGISLDALRISGGIMLFIIGLNMVFEKRTESREDRADVLLDEIEDPEDISVFPMGIPMIAGPGTMATLCGSPYEADGEELHRCSNPRFGCITLHIGVTICLGRHQRRTLLSHKKTPALRPGLYFLSCLA